MLTGYYTFPRRIVSPYIAAGAGIAFHDVGDVSSSNAKNPLVLKGRKINSFAWQVGAGAKFKASENLAFELGYRLVDSGSFKTSTTLANNDTGETENIGPRRGKLRKHEMLLGIIFKF